MGKVLSQPFTSFRLTNSEQLQLLNLLDMSGCIATIDAMGCQKKIARQIVTQEADYVLAVKESQGRLLEDVEDLFSCGERTGFENMKHDFCQTLDKRHGRIDTRRCWTIDDPEQLSSVETGKYWPGLRSIGMVAAERRQRDRVSMESRYNTSSLESDAKRLLQATRSHWGIENRVHWVLGLSFREDESRVRNSSGGSNGVLLKATNLDVPGKRVLFDKWQEPATAQNHLADWMRLNPRGSELPMGEGGVPFHRTIPKQPLLNRKLLQQGFCRTIHAQYS